ncbi:MAG: pantetheine-phosphate adenylyltransferase [Planctomycetes bacterium]|nr:pantetheine-phosphate adenylyltransferase [Planctomycetota bacterium]
MNTGACFCGTFDPPTYGHLDLARRAALLFGHVTVAIGRNASKSPLFSVEERLGFLRSALAPLGTQAEVVVFDGLATAFCRARNCRVLLRGVRSVSDFESESDMAFTNRELAADIETVLLLPAAGYAHVSSRLIREIAAGGGDLSRYVPTEVAAALHARFPKGSS